MEEVLVKYIGEWGWLTVAAITALAFKETIRNLIIGVQFFIGHDFDVDDIVWINGTKKARIVRQSINRTTFYVYGHNRKFIVPNNRLWSLNIEKDLPKTNDKDEPHSDI